MHPTSSLNRLAAFLVPLSLLPLFLVTCTLSTCTFPGSVKPTVKIGLSAPFEGLRRATGYEVLHAVRLAVRQRNDAGGVGDRYLVELVALNDFNEADEAILQAREMAADPGVLAVVGGWSPETSRSAAPEYERLGLAFVAPQADWMMLGRGAALLAGQDLNLRSAAVLQGQAEEDHALAQAFAEAFTAQGGSSLLLGTPTGEDWTKDLQADGLEAFDTVFIAADPPTVAGWIVPVRQAGFEGAIIGGPSLMSAIVASIAGEASEGVVFVSHLAPEPVDAEFVAGYEALSGGVPPGPLAAWAYDAANRMLDALDAATIAGGQPTRAAVASALEAIPERGLEVYVYVIRDGKAEVR